MSNYADSPEEKYDAICNKMQKLTEELEQNPNMSEDDFQKLLEKYGQLGKMLEQYSQMMWKK